MQELEQLMQEPPGGENFGRASRILSDSQDDYQNRRWRDLNPVDWPGEPGSYGFERATAHRGVVHPEEYVDSESLTAKVERLFGFSAAQVQEAFAEGRPTAQRLELRERVDARMLAIAEQGGNMLALAKVLGLPLSESTETGGARCKSIERSLARARDAALAVSA